MIVRTAEIKKLEELYGEYSNKLVLLYGRENCEKEQLLKLFCQKKKTFYYRARVADSAKQIASLEREIMDKCDANIQKHSYEECFNRIKSGDSSKLVVVIDEIENIVKKDTTFLDAILKLQAKKLYPGPVLIILCSSSVSFVEHELPEIYPAVLRKSDRIMKLKELKFLDLVRAFPNYNTSQCVETYGIIGGVSGYISRWNPKRDLKDNVCRNILSRNGFLFGEAEAFLETELRELSVYNAILASIAAGNQKLNDLYVDTGFSRAKISVYIKNLMAFEVVEKITSFDTGGWENAKKGVYQIKNNFINFWFTFVYPHLSDLYWMSPEEFYDKYIAEQISDYMNRYFIQVCSEYLELLNMVGKLPIKLDKMGTWVGKEGNIDIVAQDSARNFIVGACNWTNSVMGYTICEQLFDSMEKAKIKSDHYFLFSAKGFDEELKEKASKDPRFLLIDMTEL